MRKANAVDAKAKQANKPTTKQTGTTEYCWCGGGSGRWCCVAAVFLLNTLGRRLKSVLRSLFAHSAAHFRVASVCDPCVSVSVGAFRLLTGVCSVSMLARVCVGWFVCMCVCLCLCCKLQVISVAVVFGSAAVVARFGYGRSSPAPDSSITKRITSQHAVVLELIQAGGRFALAPTTPASKECPSDTL